MIFVMAVGLVLLLIGARIGITVMQFYSGQRRDLYFQAETPWIGMARLSGALILSGSGLLTLFAMVENLTPLLAIAFIGLALLIWWIAAPPLFKAMPPGWLHQLEEGRSLVDLDVIRHNGAAMLYQSPHIFRQMIRDDTGWELWLTTITGLIPLVSLELYVQRVKAAMEHHLYPVAVAAATQIIKHRPDHPIGYLLRADAFFHDYRYQSALADYSEALLIRPMAEVYYQRSRVYAVLHQKENALRDLDAALHLRPNEETWRRIRVFVQNMPPVQES